MQELRRVMETKPLPRRVKIRVRKWEERGEVIPLSATTGVFHLHLGESNGNY